MSSAPPAEGLDQELLALVNQAGHDGWTDATFTPIYRRYHRHYVSFFRRRLERPELAKDLAQDLMMNISKSPKCFDSLASFEAWMTAAARNLLRNHWRDGGALKRQGTDVPLAELEGERRPQRGSPPRLASELPDPLDAAERLEERARVAKALRQLPPAMRNVAVLRFHQDRGYEEIASLLGVSVNTVKSQLFEARKKLRELLGEPAKD